jgi:hypothetical protein
VIVFTLLGTIVAETAFYGWARSAKPQPATRRNARFKFANSGFTPTTNRL